MLHVGEIIKVTGEHSHGGSSTTLHKIRAVNKIKKRARRLNDSTLSVIGGVCSKLSSPVAALMPRIQSMSRNVQRERQTNNPQFFNPSSCEGLKIPDNFLVTLRNEQFLIYDSGGKDRTMIFGTRKNLAILSACDIIAGDGTFSSVPKLFNQLYTIHGLYHGKMLPLVYILSTNRRTKTYKKVLTELLRIEPGIHPWLVICDFELAFMKAVRALMPDADIEGCLFHYKQCQWRKIQSCGLVSNYNNDVYTERILKMICAIAFVPVRHVVDAFVLLCELDEIVYDKVLDEFLEYFECTWIGQMTRNGRREPLFPHAVWNYYEAVLNRSTTYQ